MSDLGGGRAANGGARTPGPVPVGPGTDSSPAPIRTPRDIMNARAAREVQASEQRKEERRTEERRGVDDRRTDDRRRSAERRAAAVSGAGQRYGQEGSGFTPEMAAQQAAFDGRGTGRVAGSEVLGDPTGRTSQDYTSRVRGPAVSQGQPRPAQTAPSTSRRAQAGQSARPSASASAAAGAQQPAQSQGEGGQRGTSSFPHAFERWETLSSHWEGLTSYWLHKLEANTEEIRNNVPNAVTLNRQITDLSAAGANLFHAVVELQRLRASSERKFQRWFFETRADNERHREIQAQIENQVKLERDAREDAARQRDEMLIDVENAKRDAAEVRRELAISKDEARRAWEELGRRNQESLETAQSLKEGRVTIVGGVQVLPYAGGPSRTASTSQRPTTREGQQYGSTGLASAGGGAGYQSPGGERQYYRQPDSPTNTDPFMESGTQVQPPHHDPGKPTMPAGGYAPYQVAGTPTTTSTAQTAIPLAGQRPGPLSPGSLGPSRTPGSAGPIAVSSQDAQRFYQQQQTFLHSPESSSQGIAGPQPPTTRAEVRSEGSYVDSDGDAEYAIGSDGQIQRDEQGRPIVYSRRRQQQAPVAAGSPGEDDDYDTEADIRHEQELAAQYRTAGGGTRLPEAPSVPATSAQAMASYAPTAAQQQQQQQQQRPDYEGAGYGGGSGGNGSAWEALQTRHHHPTRLSDVLEEEEERSSRHTGGLS